jgi:hypothetical protein
MEKSNKEFDLYYTHLPLAILPQYLPYIHYISRTVKIFHFQIPFLHKNFVVYPYEINYYGTHYLRKLKLTQIKFLHF